MLPQRTIFWLYYGQKYLTGIPGWNNMTKEEVIESARNSHRLIPIDNVTEYEILKSEVKVIDPKDFTKLVDYIFLPAETNEVQNMAT